MDKNRLKAIVKQVKSAKIAVVGDFCLDAYWFIDESKSEKSLETGRMTWPIKNQRYTLGGAANITNNLSVLGVKDVRAFGVIGADPFGAEMKKLMQKASIQTENFLIQEENWSTHVYSKPIIGEEEQNRIDFGNYNNLSKKTADLLLEKLASTVADVDLVIINQQVLSGIHTNYFKKKLVELIQSFPEKIFIADSRNYSDYYKGAYRKMNYAEAAHLSGFETDPDDIIPYGDVKDISKKFPHLFATK